MNSVTLPSQLNCPTRVLTCGNGRISRNSNGPRRVLEHPRGVADLREQIDMTHVTPACARPTSGHPEGRTGTPAGYRAHRRQNEEPCARCREAETGRARGRVLAVRSKGVPDGVLICAQPTRQNPGGRTGTPAGYVSHVKHGDTPCPACREGHAAAQHARYVGDRQRFNDGHRLWRYGITLAQYEAMLAAQGGGCAICATTEPGGRGEKFHIDHDHACCPGIKSCGSCIRGLLCTGCNTALGGFRDDPERLLAAVAYLTARKGANPNAVH